MVHGPRQSHSLASAVRECKKTSCGVNVVAVSVGKAKAVRSGRLGQAIWHGVKL